MELLKKVWKYALRIITGLMVILAIILVVNELSGDSDAKTYYDVENLKDYKTVKIEGMPEELQNILVDLKKDKGIDAGLEVINLYNQIDFENKYEDFKDKMKQMINIIESNTKYGDTKRSYGSIYTAYDIFYSDYGKGYDKEEVIEKNIKRLNKIKMDIQRNVKGFFSDMIQKAYEKQKLSESSLLPEYKMWDILTYNGYNNIVLDQTRRYFTAAPFDNIKEFKIGPDVDMRKSKLLLDADYIASTNVNIKYKKSHINIWGNVDNNYNVYKLSVPVLSGTYYLSVDKQNLTKDMPDTGSVLSEKENTKRAAFFKQEMNDYILHNTFGWKEHALYNKIVYDVLGESNVKILHEKFNNIKENELSYYDLCVIYKTEIDDKNIRILFTPMFAFGGEEKYKLTGSIFDKAGIQVNVEMVITEKEHEKIENLINEYVYPKNK